MTSSQIGIISKNSQSAYFVYKYFFKIHKTYFLHTIFEERTYDLHKFLQAHVVLC